MPARCSVANSASFSEDSEIFAGRGQLLLLDGLQVFLGAPLVPGQRFLGSLRVHLRGLADQRIGRGRAAAKLVLEALLGQQVELSAMPTGHIGSPLDAMRRPAGDRHRDRRR